MNKEIIVYFDVLDHEKLDELNCFINVYQYSSVCAKFIDSREWGKIILKDENLTIKFYGVSDGSGK